jgi:hypothetical protein
MARETYVLRDGELVPKWQAGPSERVGGPYIISDHLDGTASPISGKIYDSKSAYYRHIRNNGCQIVGNEKMEAPRPVSMGDPSRDIARAIQQLRG